MRRASVALNRLTVLAALGAALTRTAEAALSVLRPGRLETDERGHLRSGGPGKGRGLCGHCDPPRTITETVASDLARHAARARAVAGGSLAPIAEQVRTSDPESRARACLKCRDTRGAVREFAALPPDAQARLHTELWQALQCLTAARLGLAEWPTHPAGRAGTQEVNTP